MYICLQNRWWYRQKRVRCCPTVNQILRRCLHISPKFCASWRGKLGAHEVQHCSRTHERCGHFSKKCISAANHAFFNAKTAFSERRMHFFRDLVGPASWLHSRLVPPMPMLRRILFVTWRTFDSSFSSVSTATIARVGAFCSIFPNLQDIHSFYAAQNSEFLQNLWRKFAEFFRSERCKGMQIL